MSSQRVTIIDREHQLIAAAEVTKENGYFAGLIDLRHMPKRLRRQFEEYENSVNNQLFSLVDVLEEKIEALRLRVVFGDGQEADLVDVQVYPSTKKVSFKVAEQAVRGSGGA